MNKAWTATEIGKLIGIRSEAIKYWLRQGYIPEPARIGLRKKMIWGRTKTLAILEFARDMGGYNVPDRVMDYIRGEDEAQTK